MKAELSVAGVVSQLVDQAGDTPPSPRERRRPSLARSSPSKDGARDRFQFRHEGSEERRGIGVTREIRVCRPRAG